MIEGKPEYFTECPRCGVGPFVSFWRGKIYRDGFWYVKSIKTAVICDSCHEIVGWEDTRRWAPETNEEKLWATLGEEREWEDGGRVTFPA